MTSVSKPAPRPLWPAGGLILLLVLAAYWPALDGGLLWDDDAHVTKAGLRSFEGLGRIWTEPGATQQYYPLLHSAFWLEHRLWGDAVVGYHLVNLLLHVTAACLVVALMRRLGLPGAWLGGLIFALHPVQVESVAWISEQKNTLSAVLYLGAALLYLRFDRERRPLLYAAALAVFVLALLTKTVTATLPAALLVVFWWQRGRLNGRRDVAPLLPWFALGAAAGLFTAWMERKFIGAEGADFALSFLERILLAGRVVCFYFGKLLWPADLLFIYPRWTIDATAWTHYVFVAVVAAVGAGLCVLARRRRGPLAAFLLYGGTLFPVLGFFNVYPFLFSYVADHFQYLASLAVIVPAAVLLSRAGERWRGAAPWLRHAAAALLLLTLAILTWRQSRLYENAEGLYRDLLQRNPACWLAYNNLGNIAARDPARGEEAAGLYAEVVRLRPQSADAHFNLANARARLPGQLDAAIASYETALRLKPGFVEAASHLGNLLVRLPGRLPDAIACFESALRAKPDFAEAHVNLANALATLPERQADAIAHYETAIRLQPDFADAYFNLGHLQARTPALHAQAVASFAAALRLRPEFVEAHVNLASLLVRNPATRVEALRHYEAALALRPDLPGLRPYVERLRARTP